MDVKKFRKEMEGRSPLKKVSVALHAVKHNFKKVHDTEQRLKGIKSYKAKVASKIAKDQVDLDLHEEKAKKGYGRRAN